MPTQPGPQGICPSGWRLPTIADEIKLRELSSCHTNQYFSIDCLNNLGPNANDGLDINKYGYRDISGKTVRAGIGAPLFLASYITSGAGSVTYETMKIADIYSVPQNGGYSVRCMKDYSGGGGSGRDEGGDVNPN